MNTSSEDVSPDIRKCQENILLEIIKELCGDPKSKLSTKVKDKVNKVIADVDVLHHSSLHTLSTTDNGTSTLLGLVHEFDIDLTFEEQAELNQAIIQKIQTKIPLFLSELDNVSRNLVNKRHSSKENIRQLQESVDEKLNTLKEQENEKIQLMVEWLNHRLDDVSKFSSCTSELLTLKTKILELKSRILHLQILRNMFTETNQSVKAYSEIHKDLKDSIKETEQRIIEFKEIIESDYN